MQDVSRRSESNVWRSGLPAAGPIRPSLPWCFSPAAPSLDPSCARRKPPARRSKQFGSWHCRTAGKGKVCSWFLGIQKATFGTMGCRPRARSVLHCHGVLALRHRPWTRAVPDESPLVGGLSTSLRALGHCFFVRFRRHCLSQLVPGVGGMGAPAPLIIPARGLRGPELAVALPYGSSLLSEEKRGRRPCRRPPPPPRAITKPCVLRCFFAVPIFRLVA